MGFFQKKIDGLKRRWRCISYGIVYLKSTGFVIPASFLVNGQFKRLKFLEPSNPAFLYEFSEICLEDCYQLRLLKNYLKNVNVVVDIGANQGLFALAARHTFPDSLIHCYEPNPALRDTLTFNATSLKASPFFEAVTSRDTAVLLNFGETDLHTTTMHSEEGNVTGTALKSVIQRAGGHIDILKMDCEGAEWDLLEDTASWVNVRSITMEYHLWARPGASIENLSQLLANLGFAVIKHSPLSETFGLLVAVRKTL